MSKNFVVVVLPVESEEDYIDIPKCAFFSEQDEAKEYMEQIIFEATGNQVSIPDKPSETRVQLSDKVLELWVCYMPGPAFIN